MIDKLRKILFYIFFCAYFIICPLVILYAFGYIFSSDNREIVQTGLVSINTLPEGASLYFNNIKYKDKTPVVIRDIIPGKYKIKLYLKNYKPWEYSTNIKAGEAIHLNDILLLPASISKNIISDHIFYNIYDVPGTLYFIAGFDEKVKNYYMFNKKTGERSQINKEENKNDERVMGIDYDRKKQKLLLWTKYSIGILDFENIPEIDWFYIKGRNIKKCYWLHKGSHILFNDNGKIFIMGVEEYLNKDINFLTKIKHNSEISFYDNGVEARLYFIGKDNLLSFIYIYNESPAKDEKPHEI